ncbi:hypothetical protein BaRGS_00038851 [Batillaria attramentaria]|uniref:Uncharacterized protein n=1 Tax=Batillaria attramentaria TaxID=370345 RepID=A0ABD0J505_9CAEN
MRLFAPSRVVCFFPPQGTCSQGSFSSLRQQRLATSLFEDTVFSPHHDDRRTVSSVLCKPAQHLPFHLANCPSLHKERHPAERFKRQKVLPACQRSCSKLRKVRPLVKYSKSDVGDI